MNITKICSQCGVEKELEEFYKSKRGKLGHRSNCKHCCLIYEQNNKTRIYSKRNNLRKIKYHNNSEYRIRRLLSSRINAAFKQYSKYGKIKSCTEYGIDFLAIYNRIGNRPNSNFHLDHIIPISLFDLDNPEHVRLAHIPENLRWLPGKENIIKSDKLEYSLIISSPVLYSICCLCDIKLSYE